MLPLYDHQCPSQGLNDFQDHQALDTHRFSQGNARCAAGLRFSIAAVIGLEHEIKGRFQDQHKALKALLCLSAQEFIVKLI